MGDKNYPLKDERKWCVISMEKPKPSLNPMLPECMIIAVIAQRSDGLWMRVEGMVRMDKIRVLPTSKDGMMLGFQMVEDLLKQLETYRNCECRENKACEKHGGGKPN